MAGSGGHVAGEVTARLNLDADAFNTTLKAAKTVLSTWVATPAIKQLQLVQSAGNAASASTTAAAAAQAQSAYVARASGILVQRGSAAATEALSGQAAAFDSVGRASKNAAKAIESMSNPGVARGFADTAVQMKQMQTAMSGLVSSVAKSGGFAGLKPEVAANVRGQMDQLSSAMQRLKAGTDSASTAAKHSETSFSTLAKTVMKASIAFMGIMALKATLDVVRNAITATVAEAARFEQIAIGFEHIYGSASKAKTMLEDLANFAKTTPFELVSVEQAALRLKAYGFAAEEVIPMLTDVGDATSALGTGQEGINRITLALGQMRSAGKMNSRDMLQLTEAFVPAWDYVAQALGKTTGEVRKLTEKGLIPASIAIEAIRQGMRRDFGGMMSAQMGTLNQMVSNLKDEFTLAGREVGTAFLPALKGIVSWAAAALPVIKDFFIGLTDGSTNAGKALANVAGFIKTVLIPAIGFIATAVAEMVNFTVNILAGDWKEAWEEATDGPNGVASAIGIIAIGGFGIGKLVKMVSGAAGSFAAWATASKAVQMTLPGLGASAGGLSAIVGGLATKFAAIPLVAAALGGSAAAMAGLVAILGAVKVALDSIAGSAVAAIFGFEDLGDAARTAADKTADFWERAAARIALSVGGPRGAWLAFEAEMRALGIWKAPEPEPTFDPSKFKVGHDPGIKTQLDQVRDLQAEFEAWMKTAEDAAGSTQTLAQTQLDAANAQRNVEVAQANLNSVTKEYGSASGEAKIAALELAVAQETAAQKVAEMATQMINLALAEQYGAEMANWAAGAVVGGSAAMQGALLGLNKMLFNTIQWWDAMALAASKAWAASKAAGDNNKQAFIQSERAYENAPYNALADASAIYEGATATPGFELIDTGGGSKGGGASGVNKITGAIGKLRDAMIDVTEKVRDLADSFKQAAIEAAGAAGTMGERVRSTGTRGISAALRSQVRKLEKYRDSLLKLRGGLPQGIFEDFVLPASIDDVIGMARLNVSRIQDLLGKRANVGVEIARITQAPEIRRATADITSEAYEASRKVGANVNINFGGVTIGSNMTPEQFGKQLATIINRELRAVGMVV